MLIIAIEKSILVSMIMAKLLDLKIQEVMLWMSRIKLMETSNLFQISQ